MTRRKDKGGDVSVSWVDVVACALLAILLLLFTLLGSQGEESSRVLVLASLEIRSGAGKPPVPDTLSVDGQVVKTTPEKPSAQVSLGEGTTATVSRQVRTDSENTVTWLIVVVAPREPRGTFRWSWAGQPQSLDVTATLRYDSRTGVANKNLGRWRTLPPAARASLNLGFHPGVRATAETGLQASRENP